MKFLFLDESGDHNLIKIDMQYPIFVLGGIIIDDDYLSILNEKVDEFKLEVFGTKDIILHTADITRNKNGFERLKEKENLPRIEKRAIVTEQYVLAQDVIITKDNPMGVWCYGNIEVVELAKYCLENKFEKSLDYFDIFCKEREIPMELYNSMKRWFISQEILI